MYQCLHGNIITGKQILTSKYTSSSLQTLPHYAVVIAMCSTCNFFKVANLKWLKVRIAHCFLFFSAQHHNGNSLGMAHLSFALSLTRTYCLQFFPGKTVAVTGQLALNLLLLMQGWLLNNVAMVWSAYHCAHGTSCLCTLSAGAFMRSLSHPYISQISFRNHFMRIHFQTHDKYMQTIYTHRLSF